jgi:NAD(P)-dependent dehydrogenase (short-subunit alcohol dehydrogenase family)
VSSTVGLVGIGAGIAPYIATKHGVVGLTKTAAIGYAGQHIRVNAIAPGTTRTLVNERWIDNAQIRQSITSGIPLGRIADPAEVAEVIPWLCSYACREHHITGITNAVIVLICSVNKLHAINGFSIKVTDISYYWHRRQEQQ